MKGQLVRTNVICRNFNDPRDRKVVFFVAEDRFEICFSLQLAFALNVFIQVLNQKISDGNFFPIHDKISGCVAFCLIRDMISRYVVFFTASRKAQAHNDCQK